MSIEGFLAEQQNKPPTFKKVMGTLLAEKEPEDTRPWKWEEEITEKDKEKMIKKLPKFGTDEFFVMHAADLRMAGLEVNIDENKWYEIKKRLKAFEQLGNKEDEWYPFLGMVASLKILGFHVEIDEKIRTWVKSYFKMYYRDKNWIDYKTLAVMIKKKDPSFEFEEKPFETVWKGMHEDLIQIANYENWIGFIRCAADLKIIDQDRFTPLSPDIWKKCIKATNKYRSEVESYADIAASLRILAAHKIEITDKGLKITDDPPEKLDTSLPARPIRKKI